MTIDELKEILKDYNGDQEVGLAFVNKENKVLISHICCIRQNLSANLVEFVHAENEAIANKVQKDMEEYYKYQLQ